VPHVGLRRLALQGHQDRKPQAIGRNAEVRRLSGVAQLCLSGAQPMTVSGWTMISAERQLRQVAAKQAGRSDRVSGNHNHPRNFQLPCCRR